MDRPSDKLLKDMSSEQLSLESEWHLGQAALLFENVKEMREAALDRGEQQANDVLQAPAAKEADAEAHVHQANLLTSLMAARLSQVGVGDAHRSAKA